MENLIKKKINIYDFLGSDELYSSYMEWSGFDTYNLYPDIYKMIGKYIYDNLIKINNSNKVVDLNQIKQICEDIFVYVNNQKRYEKEAAILLKDCIMIVVLVELERNNYKIQY